MPVYAYANILHANNTWMVDAHAGACRVLNFNPLEHALANSTNVRVLRLDHTHASEGGTGELVLKS